ncbi:hypothetical protein HanRHA438_Chr12g0573161 [Helianthus annuus]|uniref:Uncharacterized protein n=1 Tax=Helianthus annuus TaxID=4232 RepID=A0A9K3MXQ7_HELAN|nr:hypothetical protein HanXRQr2_Chr12g0562011 [Helianthus annuus]KAJ0868307.1 hypothetical protein HanRHA438_Chr12g0573161 [Helianthus annuus]
MLPVNEFPDRSRVTKYGNHVQISTGMEPEIWFLDRSSDCNERQYCSESGNVPASSNSGSWMDIRRFSFSFQQETPTSLHKEVTELLLVKDQEESLFCESVSEDLRPWRQRMSSSMAVVVVVVVRRRRRRMMSGVMVVVVVAGGFMVEVVVARVRVSCR